MIALKYQCKTCEHYDADGLSIDGLGPNRTVKGCCRLGNPVTVVIPGVPGMSDTEVRSGFPHTNPDDACSYGLPREASGPVRSDR